MKSHSGVVPLSYAKMQQLEYQKAPPTSAPEEIPNWYMTGCKRDAT